MTSIKTYAIAGALRSALEERLKQESQTVHRSCESVVS